MRRTARSMSIPFSRSLKPRSPVSSLGPTAVAVLFLYQNETSLSKLKGLDTDIGQRSDTGARRRGRRGKGFESPHIGNVDMRKKDVKRRDVEILEAEFDLVILVLGSILFAGEYMKQDKPEVLTSK